MRRLRSSIVALVATALTSLVLAAPASAGPPWALIYPTSGRIGDGVGACRPLGSCTRRHTGVDIANSGGTDIFAAYRGTAYLHPDSGGDAGNWIEVVHANGYSTRYLHLQSFLVSNGQAVRKGQHIGEMGQTGDATGNHLHYEVRNSGCSAYGVAGVCDINAGFPAKGGSIVAKNPMPMDFYLAAADIAPFTNELAFVATQHQDFYGRPITSGEAVLWIDALWNGTSGSDMANRLLKSSESEGRGMVAIARLYYAAFDRQPDKGAIVWAHQNTSLLNVASAFLNSSEGKQKLPTNPEAFVRKLYTNALNRNASASEVSYWAGQVRSKGRASVLVAISQSSEHKKIRRGMAPLQAIYLAMLGRPADSGAYNHWLPILNDAPAATFYLVDQVRHSAEYGRRF